jgi:tetratricopeptide (TPR) repeat protein
MTDQSLIDRQIMEGYKLLSKSKTLEACDIWLEAWEGIKMLMSENAVTSVREIDDIFRWTEFPYNCVQDLENELHNAGLDDPDYYRKRISYCRELLNYVGDDKLMEGNTRRAIADSYFELGDTEECDRLYGQWLNDDPKWGMGYFGWSQNYAYEYHGRQDIGKAAKIKERALAEPELRDRLEVVDDALVFFEENGGDADRIKALREEFAVLKAASPAKWTEHKAIPLTSNKIGRNDPCPCGSGKKYKKCHGALDFK